MKKKKVTIKDLQKQIEDLQSAIQSLQNQIHSLNHDMMPYRPIGPCKPYEPPRTWGEMKIDQDLIDKILAEAKKSGECHSPEMPIC